MREKSSEEKSSEKDPAQTANRRPEAEPPRPAEYGGPKGPEPTRYGDWERKGICTDF